MFRGMIAIAALALMACGGDDSKSGSVTDSLPDVSAAADALADAGNAAIDDIGDAASDLDAAVSDAADSAAKTADDAVVSGTEAVGSATDAVEGAIDGIQDSASSAATPGCLGLIGSGEFAAAIPVCTQELKADPGNAQIEQALEQAKAAGSATSGSDAVGAAAGALGDKMP